MAKPSSFRAVVQLWPTLGALREEIGITEAALSKWSQRDRIPAPFWLPLVKSDVARRNGVTLELLARLAANGREP